MAPNTALADHNNPINAPMHYLANIVLDDLLRAGEVVRHEVHEILLDSLGIEDQSRYSQESQEQREQGEHCVVGHPGSQMGGVVVLHLTNHPQRQGDESVLDEGAGRGPRIGPLPQRQDQD